MFKLIFAEAKHRYHNYFFPYQVLLYCDEPQKIEEIYEKGFLPFRHRQNLFYLARSSRCVLEKFHLSSENRRILKKTAQFKVKKLKTEEFSFQPSVQKNCKDWAKGRGWHISTRSLKYLFGGVFFNRIWVWSREKKVVGYQVLLERPKLLHTAHVFYHPEWSKSGLGVRMLLEATRWAAENKKKFHYLGTCYGKTGFYKRTLPGFEFFNGWRWSNNLKEWEYFDRREKDDYVLREERYWDQFADEDLKQMWQ